MAGLSTVDDVPLRDATRPEDARRLRRTRAGRRAILAVVGLVVLAGVATLLGVRTESVSATGGGYDLEVRYPRFARGGLAITWSIEVRRPGGFDGPVTLATNGDYLALFDENGLDPDPSAATADDEDVIWEFEPPPGDTLKVELDARIEPAVHWGKGGRTKLLVDDEVVAEVSYHTWIAP